MLDCYKDKISPDVEITTQIVFCHPSLKGYISLAFFIEKAIHYLLYFTVMDTSKERLIQIIRERSFQYSNTPKFKLSSGAISSFYFNMKKTTQSPEGMHIVGKVVFDKIKELNLEPDAIGGLTMGADPIAYSVAMHSQVVKEPINAFVIRKEPKEYGLRLPIEGDIQAGDHVIVVDDVVTTGGSTIKAINIAKENDLIIDAVIILVDRCEQNGRQNIEELGFPVYCILNVHDFVPSQN